MVSLDHSTNTFTGRKAVMNRIVSLIVLMMFVFSQLACSVYKAASQPGPADLQGIGVGTPRPILISKVGAPKFSDTDSEGKKTGHVRI